MLKITLKYTWLYLLSVLSAALLSWLLTCGLGIISAALDVMLAYGSVDFGAYAPRLFVYMAICTLCAAVKAVSSRLFGAYAVRDIKNLAVCKVTRLPYEYFMKNGTGGISSKFIEDTANLSTFFCDILPEMSALAVSALVLLKYIYSINTVLLLAVIISYPLVFLGIKAISRQIIDLAEKRRRFVDIETNTVYDILNGIETVKSFNLYNIMSGRLSAVMNDIFSVEKVRAKITSVTAAVRMLIKWLPSVICLCAGAVLAIHGKITAGSLMVYVIAAERCFDLLGSLPYQINMCADLVSSVKSINSLLAQPEEISGGDADTGGGDTAVQLKNVCFKYGEKQVLYDINITVKSGEKAALVGSSGGGKTTILNIISTLEKPSGGDYIFFGKNINTMDLDAVRSKIAVISQFDVLFPTTIRQNVAYGNTSADDQSIENACKKANIHDFIMSLPDGYDTQTGERGAKLSGGEKQRLMLARAYVRNAKIIAMDEPTAALDADSERAFCNALKNTDKDTAVIISAHRIKTAADCDKIYVIENGRICEQGSHSSLMSLHGRYYSLYTAAEE